MHVESIQLTRVFNQMSRLNTTFFIVLRGSDLYWFVIRVILYNVLMQVVPLDWSMAVDMQNRLSVNVTFHKI